MLARLAGISPMVIGIGACGGVGVDGECSDGVQNGAETAVDCGGGCDPCGDGEGCASGLDCQNGICTNQMCAPAACIDNLKNGDESDIDCGGACGPTCQTTQDCNSGGDCQEGVCNGTCAAPTCTDGVRNSDETDMDCGGSCTGCAIGLTCEVPGDCGSGNCTPDAICGDAFRRVFITSQTTSGAMGGIAVGDALCQSLATSAGLTG